MGIRSRASAIETRYSDVYGVSIHFLKNTYNSGSSHSGLPLYPSSFGGVQDPAGGQCFSLPLFKIAISEYPIGPTGGMVFMTEGG